VAAPDRRAEDRPSRWGYIAAIIVSAAAHAGIALFVLLVLPRLWRQDLTPLTAYTVKVVDNIPAGDLGRRLPPLDDERQQAQEPPPPEDHPEEPKPPPEVQPKAAPTAPPLDNDKTAIALNSTPALVRTPTPTPTPAPPTPAPTATSAPIVEATIAPTPPPTPEETPEPSPKPTPRPHHTPHPRLTPRPPPRPTPRPRPRATPRPRPTPRPTPESVRHHPPTMMIAKAEPTPNVKQQFERLREELLEEHLRAITAAKEKEREQRNASENPGSGPVVASRVTNGHGYGVGPGTGSAGIEQDTEFLLYYKDVQDKIKESWNFAGGNPNLTATVVFGINPDGSLNELKVISGSSDPAFDDSVLRAIKRAAPFLPPPDKYRSQFAGGIRAEFKLGQLKS
jgi:TonB family protein